MSKVQEYLEKKRIEASGLPKIYVVFSSPKGVESIIARQVTEIIDKDDHKIFKMDAEFPDEIKIPNDGIAGLKQGYGSGFGDTWCWTYYCTLSVLDATDYSAKEKSRIEREYIQPNFFKDFSEKDLQITDILGIIYPGTMFRMIEDIEKQILEIDAYLVESKHAKSDEELKKYTEDVKRKKRIVTSLLKYWASYNHPGFREQELCDKYGVQTFKC